MAQPRIAIATITFADVLACLAQGWHDFTRAPALGLFFGAIYVLGGWFIYLMLAQFHMPWMILPVALGFPLIGPFIAVGLYEISRRLESGQKVTWLGVLGVIFAQKERQLGGMAFVVLFIFWIWIYQVRLLLALFLGFHSFPDTAAFITVLTATPDGWAFLAIGTLVGAGLAFVLFCATVTAIPLLLARDYDFVTAVITSFQSVLRNLPVMLIWGLMVVIFTALALAPAFLGLLIALPVLGHTTWHLYRRLVKLPG
ncbi:MAG: DUF2189 domain-containing protein [Aestuariivirgaceae bacterium]|nr:DUF2189 domain-containing protein [Aestuariivirgaceae bacterium]